jgi:hypothetical protein
MVGAEGLGGEARQAKGVRKAAVAVARKLAGIASPHFEMRPVQSISSDRLRLGIDHAPSHD